MAQAGFIAAVLLTAMLFGAPMNAGAIDIISVPLQGELSGDLFGFSVDRAGDINNDGFDDYIVGSPGAVTLGGATGSVGIFFGREGVLPAQADVVIPGEVSGDEFGFAVAGIGDVNLDGFDDFMVGAPGHDSASLDAGRVYVFLGSDALSGVAVETRDGDCPTGRFGESVAGRFDFNGDGRPDFAAGAPEHNCTGAAAGQVRIYVSKPAGQSEERYIFHGDQANWALGRSVSGVGDLNGDGFDEVAVGAPQPHDSNSGRVVVVFGQDEATEPARLVLSGETGHDLFGWDVSAAGDINNDGSDDLLVGAPGVGSENGAVYLYHGAEDFDDGFDWVYYGPTGGRQLGWAVDGGLDFNGDGRPDFAAGEPGANSIAAKAGGVRMWWGKPSLTNGGDQYLEPHAPISSFEANDAFGFSLAFVGSSDGDEVSELMAGAPTGNGTNGEVGYANFVAGDTFVPVRTVSLSAVLTAGDLLVEWSLMDAHELVGVRVRGDGRALHSGWLPGSQSSFQVFESVDQVRLEGLTRLGAVVMLGETSVQTRALQLRVTGPHPFAHKTAS